MSFSFEVKQEILAQEFSHDQAIDFISGLVAVDNDNQGRSIVKINNPILASEVHDLLRQLKFTFHHHPANKNWIEIDGFKPNHTIKQPASFFAGVFVGGGSISDPKTTFYHLEIQFVDSALASKVKNYLNKYDFNFVEIKRRHNWIIYLKKSELITDFLRVIGAFNSLIKFEDARISRDFKNQLNRYSNLDTYNQKKLAYASSAFQNDYQHIIDHNLTDQFTSLQLTFYQLKHKNPYLSLADLLVKFNTLTKLNKTRSCLGHYLIKLKKVVHS